MYHVCKLVHADLSEYNILYHHNSSTPAEVPSSNTPTVNQDSDPAQSDTAHSTHKDPGTLYIIDVSQSVEHDHPSAYDFLRSDLKNIKRFFEGWGVRCLSLRRAFEFVTQEVLQDTSETGPSGEEGALKAWIDEEESANGLTGENDELDETELEKEIAATKASEDSVFLNSFIPRNLNDMINPERVLDAHIQQENERLDNAKSPKKSSRVRFDNVPKQEQESDEDSDQERDEDEEGTESEEQQDGDGKTVPVERKSRGHRHEDREAKKVCFITSIRKLLEYANIYSLSCKLGA